MGWQRRRHGRQQPSYQPRPARHLHLHEAGQRQAEHQSAGVPAVPQDPAEVRGLPPLDGHALRTHAQHAAPRRGQQEGHSVQDGLHLVPDLQARWPRGAHHQLVRRAPRLPHLRVRMQMCHRGSTLTNCARKDRLLARGNTDATVEGATSRMMNDLLILPFTTNCNVRRLPFVRFKNIFIFE